MALKRVQNEADFSRKEAEIAQKKGSGPAGLGWVTGFFF
jgi:hypothetical protein